MAAPSYTKDLVPFATGDEASGWVEMTGTILGEAYNAQGLPAYQDPDYPFIQGSYSVTQDCSKDTSVGSLAYNYGTPTPGHGPDGAYFVWQNYMVASNIGTYAQGGFQIVVGSSAAAFKTWYVGGVNRSPYPYGGWVNSVVNTSVTPTGTAGTPGGNEQYVGSAVFVTIGSSKGEVHNCDAIRFGRGTAIFKGGDSTNGYATFPGFAAQNDTNTNRWGLIQETAGGYLWKGRMLLGSGSAAGDAVDFRDGGRLIFVQWTPKVTANFNLIEVVNSNSNVAISGSSFICLDTTTASRGRWLVTDDAPVTLTSVTFSDMDTFHFSGSTTASACTWARCAEIYPEGGNISGCDILAPAVVSDSGAVVWDRPVNPSGKLNNLIITKGTTAHHAVWFGQYAPTDMSISGLTTSGFNSSDSADDSTFYFEHTTGTVTLTLTGFSGYSSYKSAGATIDIQQSVDVEITVTDEAGDPIQDAQTAVYTSPGGTQIGNADTLADGTATFAYTGSTPQDIVIKVRKSSTGGATRYFPYRGTGRIGALGVAVTVTLVEDPIAPV